MDSLPLGEAGIRPAGAEDNLPLGVGDSFLVVAEDNRLVVLEDSRPLGEVDSCLADAEGSLPAGAEDSHFLEDIRSVGAVDNRSVEHNCFVAARRNIPVAVADLVEELLAAQEFQRRIHQQVA